VKTVLVPIKLKDPELSGYDVVDPETGLVLGVARQCWHETIRASKTSYSHSRKKTWVSYPAGAEYGSYVKSRKAAVDHVLGQA
jgi:hypothetical protein